MPAKINFGSDEDFIKNYRRLKSSRKMGELYNCDKGTVLKHAKEIGFDVTSVQNYKLSAQDKEEILKAYHTQTSTQLAKKYNVSRGMITKIWYDNNCRGKEIKSTPCSLDLTGQKISLLTVLEKTDIRSANGSVLWLCRCDCGNEVTVEATRLNTKRAKSCGCLSKKALEKGRGINFQDLSNKRFGKLTPIYRNEDKVLNDKNYVNWICQCDCGRITSVLAANLRTGNTQSCGLCGERSHGNIKIDQILTKAEIPFEREKRFSDCKDTSCLPFDFFVDNKYLIEYDGRQHFEKDNFFYSEKIELHDKIKNDWCKDHKIPLIRIPYTHYNNLCLEDLLLETSKYIL